MYLTDRPVVSRSPTVHKALKSIWKTPRCARNCWQFYRDRQYTSLMDRRSSTYLPLSSAYWIISLVINQRVYPYSHVLFVKRHESFIYLFYVFIYLETYSNSSFVYLICKGKILSFICYFSIIAVVSVCFKFNLERWEITT